MGYRGSAIIVTDYDLSSIRQLTAQWENVSILSGVKNLAQHLIRCDLVVTKLGVITLEAFCLGRSCLEIQPTIAHVELSDHLNSAYRDWPALNMGLANEDTIHQAANTTINLLKDRPRLESMGQRAKELVDGRGAQRIIEELINS